MVYLHTKIPNLVILEKDLEWKRLVYQFYCHLENFVVYWYILFVAICNTYTNKCFLLWIKRHALSHLLLYVFG
jgi:hypothetical protein